MDNLRLLRLRFGARDGASLVWSDAWSDVGHLSGGNLCVVAATCAASRAATEKLAATKGKRADELFLAR